MEQFNYLTPKCKKYSSHLEKKKSRKASLKKGKANPQLKYLFLEEILDFFIQRVNSLLSHVLVVFLLN